MTNPTPITTDELAAMEQRCQAATPGPWEAAGVQSHEGAPIRECVIGVRRAIDDGEQDIEVIVSEASNGNPQDSMDMYFIAHARSDMPRLIRDLRAERRENSEQRRILQGVANDRDALVGYYNKCQELLSDESDKCERLRAEVERLRELLAKCDDIRPCACCGAKIAWFYQGDGTHAITVATGQSHECACEMESAPEGTYRYQERRAIVAEAENARLRERIAALEAKEPT